MLWINSGVLRVKTYLQSFDIRVPFFQITTTTTKSLQSCPTLWDPMTAAHQAPPSLGFSRQEHWSGLPFPSPMHESEKWKWSRSVVSDSSRPHGLQPTRLLCPWDFPGKSSGVGCHCLLPIILQHGLFPSTGASWHVRIQISLLFYCPFLWTFKIFLQWLFHHLSISLLRNWWLIWNFANCIPTLTLRLFMDGYKKVRKF